MKLAKPKTFGKAEAFELVGRLVQHWPYMAQEQGSEKVLAREYELQFKGYDPEIVDAAATAVIGEPGRAFGPKPGELKAAVRAELIRRNGPPERATWRLKEDEGWTPPTEAQKAEVTEALDKFLKRGRYAVKPVAADPGEAAAGWSVERDVEEFRRKYAAFQVTEG